MLKKRLILLLKTACFFLFLGRGWQHIMWDIPIRSLFWDQELMEGLITWLTNMSWQEYATSTLQDTFIQTLKVIFGVFYIACAILVFFINENRKWIGKVFVITSFFLTFLAFLYCKEKFFHLGQFFEYTTQIASPILLYLFIYTKTSYLQLIRFGKIVIALTFICHGLYAIGYYPQPGNFVDMVIQNLYISETSAKVFLKIIGVLDILVGIGFFIPIIWRVFMWYTIIWGLITALARVTTNFYIDFPWQTLNQWIPEMLYRIPHGIIPIFILILANSILSEKKKDLNLK